MRRPDGAAGIYVHIPFCARLCPYCDFAVSVRRQIPHDSYVDALLREWEARRAALAGRDVRTLYFGGGTPSLLRTDALARLTRALSACGPFEEVTLEANPADVSVERLEAWRQAGVTRLSIGVQSFQPRYLAALGRNHDPAQAHAAVEAAVGAGLQAVSIDLIFAGPGHTEQEWCRDLEVVEALEIEHLSAYHLTVEPNTVFFRRQARGELDLPEDERAVTMLEQLAARLEARGLERYEVSSFGAPGAWSRHNSGYWTGAEYLGLGVGAHSLTIDERIVRRANPRRLDTYLTDPLQPAEVEELEASQHWVERLFLGLRTRHGVDLEALARQLDGHVDEAKFSQAQALFESFAAEGFVDEDAGTWRPTTRGLLFGDSLAERIFDVLA